MTDQTMNNCSDDLARELREAEKLEKGLDRALSALQPPWDAAQRLLARLGEGAFHESQLTLDDAGPYSFAQALAQSEADAEAGSDLLAAGLEEEPVEDDDETDAD